MTCCSDQRVCSICFKPIDDEGHNAAPINTGRCCVYCNYWIVAPARIQKMKNETMKEPTS